MAERTTLLYKFNLLREYYPDINIPYNTDTIEVLRYQYNIALHRAHEYLQEQKIKEQIKQIHTTSLMCLEILACKISDLRIKTYIRDIQRSHTWTMDTITNYIYPLLDYCILTGTYNSQAYFGASLIYWFITDGPLAEYRSIVIDSIKDEPDLMDIINYIEGNYIPIKYALE